jgi:uncharacterized membrane protein YdjX (TVP38/TMEM64 family)
MKKLNPVYLLIAFNLLYFAFGHWFGSAPAWQAFSHRAEAFVAGLGFLGYVGVVGAYFVCAFFFIPLLIPLNVASGALYGPYLGTAVSLAGITAGCLASTVSVRYVFTGMQGSIEKHPSARKVLDRIGAHGDAAVLMLRLAFVVPYLWQNIILALAPLDSRRLAVLTAIGSLPGAAIYCFLGAGLMRPGDAGALAVYLAVAVVLLGLIWLALKYLNAKYQSR